MIGHLAVAFVSAVAMSQVRANDIVELLEDRDQGLPLVQIVPNTSAYMYGLTNLLYSHEPSRRHRDRGYHTSFGCG